MRTSLRTAIKAEAEKAKAICDAASNEDRDLTDVERETVAKHIDAAAAMHERGAKDDELRAKMINLGSSLGPDPTPDDISRVAEIVGSGAKGAKAEQIAQNMTLGAQFTESKAFKDLIGTLPPGASSFGEKMRVQSSAFAVPGSLLAGGSKALVTGVSDTSAGALIQNDFRGMLDPFYQRPLTIRDVVTNGSTTSDLIEYVRLTSVTNNAAPVAEAQSTLPIGDGTGGTTTAVLGGLKPESSMVFARATTSVKTIAHWIPVTKRALADAAQIRTLIDAFLRYGLEEELEDQMVTGSGSGENFLGIANTSGVQTQAAPAGDETILDTTRMARRKVRIGGRAIPTAYVMNPLDWEAIELLKDAENRYYGGGPFALTTPRLWGLPVIESEAIAAGTIYCGAWNQAVLYDREQATVQATDSHSDFFTRNLVVLLAELRAAFAVLRPSAFVKITVA